jgi:hypothetical protein
MLSAPAETSLNKAAQPAMPRLQIGVKSTPAAMGAVSGHRVQATLIGCNQRLS